MIFFANNEGISTRDIAVAAGGKLISGSERNIKGIAIDSRDVEAGALFVAIPGERTDGHKYIPTAVKSGAAAVLAEEKIFCSMYSVSGVDDSEKEVLGVDVNIILVDDTVAALGRIAKNYLEKLDPMVVAITGSVGKTTTKELIYSVISQKIKTHKTEGNYNSTIGLPLTVMSVGADERALVLEMGMSGKGEISQLTDIARPDIAVITNIGTSHIGILGSREAIRDAKMEIAEGLDDNGVLVLNGDEPLLAGYDAVYVATENQESDVLIRNVREYAAENYSLFDLYIKNDKKALADIKDFVIENIRVNSLGSHVVFDAAIAVTVGILAGIDIDSIRTGILDFYHNPMRQSVSERNVVLGGCAAAVTVIEDCYNASPESMTVALSVLESVKKSAKTDARAVAVLGDMRELGEYSAELHKKIGRIAAEKADIIFTLGADAENIAKGAIELGFAEEKIYSFGADGNTISGTDKLADSLAQTLRDGDVVLFKASRAVALEQVIKKIFG